METTNNLDVNNTPFRLPSVTVLSVVVELLIIVVMAVIVTLPLLDMDTAKQLPGTEYEVTMSYMTTIARTWQTKGYIPLWQPYLEYGEPLLNNPFIFLFNPIESIPTLAMGAINGPKIAFILSVILVGLGGWALGRMLGLRALARVVLGLLLIGKGNMTGMLTPGYFQLAVAQAYFPWILAGTIGILWFRRRRWPIVLTAASIALMFWSGLFWFLLPIILMIGVFFLFHIIRFRRKSGVPSKGFNWDITIDLSMVRRMVFAGVLTGTLCALTFLPLWVNQKYLGQSSVGADVQANLGSVMSTFFSNNPDPTTSIFGNGLLWEYYSYILPDWFAIALLVVFLLTRFNRYPGPVVPNRWRVIIAGLILFVFCVFWGAGQNPIIEWAYTAIPLVSQFRNVSRVLGVASFLLAVLAAIALDMIWLSVILPYRGRFIKAQFWQTVQRPLLAIVIIASTAASLQLLSSFTALGGLLWPVDSFQNSCIEWVRAQDPNGPVAVWTVGSQVLNEYLNSELRHVVLASDFYHAQGLPAEFGPPDLIHSSLPEYALVFQYPERDWAASLGYKPLAGSPSPDQSPLPCVMVNSNALSYMYTAPASVFQKFATDNKITASMTTPVTSFDREMDRVAAIVKSDPNDITVLTAQELDDPGWTVQLDGVPVHVLSVGGEVGVYLPPDGKTHTVLFQYKPTLLYVGAVITLISILVSILYLLRVDRFIPASLQRATSERLSGVMDFMLDPTVLDSKDHPDFEPAAPPLKQLPPGDVAQPEKEDEEIEVIVIEPR